MDSVPPTLHRRLLAGELRHAAWLGLREPLLAEAVARSGVDLIVFDLQHGAIEAADLLTLLQVAQPFVPVLVRLPAVDPTLVTRVLDLGADGVVVPLVDGPEDARRVVEAALYPPAGRRS